MKITKSQLRKIIKEELALEVEGGGGSMPTPEEARELHAQLSEFVTHLENEFRDVLGHKTTLTKGMNLHSLLLKALHVLDSVKEGGEMVGLA